MYSGDVNQVLSMLQPMEIKAKVLLNVTGAKLCSLYALADGD